MRACWRSIPCLRLLNRNDSGPKAGQSDYRLEMSASERTQHIMEYRLTDKLLSIQRLQSNQNLLRILRHPPEVTWLP